MDLSTSGSPGGDRAPGDGVSGADATHGTPSPQGAPGTSGTSGTAGTSGTSAAHGTAGTPGVTRAADAVAMAEALGVVDALLFRRVSPGTWAHLGGLGRGRGWAGLVEVDEAADPLVCRIPARVGQVLRTHADEPIRILGPYYAAEAAVVRTSNDVAVLLGNPTGGLADADDERFRTLADLLDRTIDDVLPSKRLADELEVLHTVRALMAAPTDAGLADTLHHVVTVAAQALSCEIGVLLDGTGHLAVVPPDAGGPTGQEWREVLGEIADRMDGQSWCVQDVASAGPLRLTELLPTCRSLLALAVPPPIGGTLLLLHTDSGPRGFTSLCRRLGQHVVDTGSVVARTAALRDELRAAAARASHVARTDSLTGLGNRLAWDEAVAAAQERVDGGAAVSVITLDLDGLKQINDEHGHDAGDDLLRRCAQVIRTHCGPNDVAVRMGGDEFAILIPGESGPAERRYADLATALNAPSSTRDTVAASVGLGTAGPSGRLADAVRDADIQMYRHKRERRRRIADPAAFRS